MIHRAASGVSRRVYLEKDACMASCIATHAPSFKAANNLKTRRCWYDLERSTSQPDTLRMDRMSPVPAQDCIRQESQTVGRTVLTSASNIGTGDRLQPARRSVDKRMMRS